MKCICYSCGKNKSAVGEVVLPIGNKKMCSSCTKKRISEYGSKHSYAIYVGGELRTNYLSGAVEPTPGPTVTRTVDNSEFKKKTEKHMKQRQHKFNNKFKDGHTFWEMFWDEFNSIQ